MAVTQAPASALLAWTNYVAVSTSRRPPLDAFTFVSIRTPNVRVEHNTGTVAFRVGQVTVPVSVDHGRSWVVADRRTDALLQHERLHYRIGIQVARALDTQLSTASGSSAAALRRTMQTAIDDAGRRMGAIFDAYDADSAHGQVAEQQRLWEMRVGRWEQVGSITFP